MWADEKKLKLLALLDRKNSGTASDEEKDELKQLEKEKRDEELPSHLQPPRVMGNYYYSIIPKQFIKHINLGSGATVSGTQDYVWVDGDEMKISISQGGFEWSIKGREELEKIKAVIDFALQDVPVEKKMNQPMGPGIKKEDFE